MNQPIVLNIGWVRTTRGRKGMAASRVEGIWEGPGEAVHMY